MKKGKFLVIAAMLAINLSCMIVTAEPIVELAAPRHIPRIVADDGTPNIKPKIAPLDGKSKTSASASKSKKSHKKHIAHRKPKPVIIKVNYDYLSKLIEYGYYYQADNQLEDAISRNNKDIKAISLLAVSHAKQSALDPVQADLNILLKKYPDNSNLHYAQGIVYYQRTTSSNLVYRNKSQEFFNSALIEFQKAIKLDKTNARAYNAAGVVSLKLGKNEDAKKYFKQAIALDKTYSMAIDNLGTFDLTDGKLKDAQKKFDEALKYNSQNSTAMYHLAQIAMQNKDYSKALTYLNDALYINQGSPAIYNLMAKAYYAQGNEAAAIDSLKKSVSVKPEYTLSYIDLANIYNRRGDSEFAIEQLKTALNINPDYSEAKLLMADILLDSCKYKQAVSVYSELVGVDGYNDKALKGLASSYYGLAQASASKAYIGSNKNLLDALGQINKAIAANNNDMELNLAKLKLTKLANQPDETKVVLNKIISSPANDLMGNVVKGEACLTLNDYDNAQKYFNLAVGQSNTTESDLNLAEILLYKNQLSLSEKLLNKVLKNEPTNQQAIADLAYLSKCKKHANNYYSSALKFLKNGNKSMAIEYLSRSLEIDSNNAQAQLILAELYDENKDYDSALVHYKAYLSLAPYARDCKKITRRVKKLDSKL